jgi:PAS domain S-box-containing protein
MILKEDLTQTFEILEQVFDSKGESFLLLDENKTILFCNKTAKEFYLNYGFENIIDKSVENILQSLNKNEFDQLFKNALQGEKINFYKTLFSTSENKTKHYKISLSLLNLACSDKKTIIHSFEDITAQKEFDTEFENNKIFLSTINQLLPAYIFIYDIDLEKVVFCNQDFRNCLGFEDVFDKNEVKFSELFSGELSDRDKSITYKNIKNTINSSENKGFEIELLFKDKKSKPRYFLSKYVVFKRDNNQIKQLLGIATDISEKKNLDEEILSFNKKRVQDKEKLNKLKSMALLQGQEKERRRLSQDLHDGIGQMLFAVKMKLNLAISNLKKANNTESTLNDLLYSYDLVSQTINETRRVSHDLMPNVLFDFGFIPALNNLIENFRKTNNQILLEFNQDIIADFDPESIDDKVSLAIYRIFQETLNNAYKYSEAKNIIINFTITKNEIKFSIKDDGIGFDTSKNMNLQSQKAVGSGLSNIRERVNLLNGNFTIFSQPNEGVLLIIKIPI